MIRTTRSVLNEYFEHVKGILLFPALNMIVISIDGDTEDIQVEFVGDNVKYNCQLSRILKKVSSETYLVKWIDGRNYEAKILKG